MSDVVQKLWEFCHTLRHDGIDYGDYIEQLTYLLFLKMADERGIDLSKTSVTTEKGEKRKIDCSWPGLEAKSGTGLTEHYIDVLRALGQQKGLLGDIFTQAQSLFNNPVNLKKLIGLIDETEWTSIDIDVKAAAFEGLLEKAASEGKKGAGQYFTPRILIQSIVRCVKPDPRAHREFTICDPACGTGGFLVASYEWLIEQTRGGALDRDLAKRIRQGTYFGGDLVPRPRRLALMNLYLHGLEPDIKLGDSIYEVPGSRRYDVVLTNPPFGTKGANQVPEREDFVIATSNKQLNFIQHVMTILKPGGPATSSKYSRKIVSCTRFCVCQTAPSVPIALALRQMLSFLLKAIPPRMFGSTTVDPTFLELLRKIARLLPNTLPSSNRASVLPLMVAASAMRNIRKTTAGGRFISLKSKNVISRSTA